MTGNIKHTTQIVGTNNPDVQISKDPYNAAHTIEDKAIGIAKIDATGTPDATKFLRGDGSWQIISGGGDMLKSTYDADDDGIVDNAEKLEGSTKAQVQDHAPKAHTHPETELTLTDISTNNTTTAKHGLCPKLNNQGSQYLDGQGNWSTPSAGSGEPHNAEKYLIINDGGTWRARNGDTGSFDSSSVTPTTPINYALSHLTAGRDYDEKVIIKGSV